MSGIGRCKGIRAFHRELEEKANIKIKENLYKPAFLENFVNTLRHGIPQTQSNQNMCPPNLQKMEGAVIQINKPYKVSIVLVPFLSSSSVSNLLDQIVNKTNCNKMDIDLVILDNSDNEIEQKKIENKCNSITKFKTQYIYSKRNLKLAASLNLAVEYCNSDFMVYLCSKDCYIYHKNWLKYMIDELMKYNDAGSVVMGGQMYGFDQGFDDLNMNMHIQGGIYITYTNFFKTHKYEAILFPHVFMDVIYCKQLIKNGYHFINLPKIKSFAGDGWSNLDHLKNLKNHKFYIVHSRECKDYLLEG